MRDAVWDSIGARCHQNGCNAFPWAKSKAGWCWAGSYFAAIKVARLVEGLPDIIDEPRNLMDKGATGDAVWRLAPMVSVNKMRPSMVQVLKSAFFVGISPMIEARGIEIGRTLQGLRSTDFFKRIPFR